MTYTVQIPYNIKMFKCAACAEQAERGHIMQQICPIPIHGRSPIHLLTIVNASYNWQLVNAISSNRKQTIAAVEILNVSIEKSS